MTTVLGIDPGPTQSGVCIFDGKRTLFAAVMDNAELLELIKFNEWDPEVMAVERIVSYGKAIDQGTIDTAVMIGRCLQAWEYDDSTMLIPRPAILRHVLTEKVQKGKADAQVRAALIARLGEPGSSKKRGPTYGVTSHAWSALAVAVTAYDRLQEG